MGFFLNSLFFLTDTYSEMASPEEKNNPTTSEKPTEPTKSTTNKNPFNYIKLLHIFNGSKKYWPDSLKKVSLWLIATSLLTVCFYKITDPGTYNKFLKKITLKKSDGGDKAKGLGISLTQLQQKISDIAQADKDNERLRLENMYLRVQLKVAQFDCGSRAAQEKTQDLGNKLQTETGSPLGQTLSSISYRPPSHLPPIQLYALAVTYFRAREDEKAAVLFSFLTGLEDNDYFKTPKNYLNSAISWYRLDHYELADSFLDKVLLSQESVESVQFHAQARLWKGLVAERLGKHAKSQFWIRQLVDHHPHSTEAMWVNHSREEGSRGTTTEK